MSKEESIAAIVGQIGDQRVVMQGNLITLESKRKDAMGCDYWDRDIQYCTSDTVPFMATMRIILAGHAEAVKQLYETNAKLHAHLDVAELAIGQAMQWLGEWHKAVADKDEDALACAELLLYKEAGFAAPNPMPGQEG